MSPLSSRESRRLSISLSLGLVGQTWVAFLSSCSNLASSPFMRAILAARTWPLETRV